MEESNVYTVLQLCDSAFPTGGFSHSVGAEAAIQNSYIKTKDDLKTFIMSALENVGSFSLPFVRASHENHLNHEKLQVLDSLLNAMLTSHVAKCASKLQGHSLLYSSCETFSEQALTEVQTLVGDEKLCGHQAIIFGVVHASLNISTKRTVEMFLFSALRTIMASLVRLGKIGAVEAQKFQYEIQKNLGDIISRNWDVEPDDANIAFPVLDILQNSHDTFFSKLFIS